MNQDCQHLLSEFLVQILNLGASCPQEEMHWDQSHRQNLSPRDGHLTATGRLESISFNYTPFHPKTKRIKRKHKKSYVSLPFSKPNKTLEKNTLRRPEIYPWGNPPMFNRLGFPNNFSKLGLGGVANLWPQEEGRSPWDETKLNQPHFVALKKCNNLQVFLKNSASDQWMAESQLLDLWRSIILFCCQSGTLQGTNIFPTEALLSRWFSFFQGGIF